MKINEIQNLIRFIAKSGIVEFELEMKDFAIRIKNPRLKSEIRLMNTLVPIITTVNQIDTDNYLPAIEEQTETALSIKEATIHPDELNYVTVKSPMIGTFYLTPSPGNPPFVNVGDKVKKGQPLCVIEAMKLFNEIESEVAGEIIKILIDDASPVEYDASLFLINPS